MPKPVTLDTAQEAFRANPDSIGADLALAYARELIRYHSDEMIGNDTFRAGMLELVEGRTGGLSDMGGRVSVEVKAI